MGSSRFVWAVGLRDEDVDRQGNSIPCTSPLSSRVAQTQILPLFISL